SQERVNLFLSGIRAKDFTSQEPWVERRRSKNVAVSARDFLVVGASRLAKMPSSQRLIMRARSRAARSALGGTGTSREIPVKPVIRWSEPLIEVSISSLPRSHVSANRACNGVTRSKSE